MCPALPAAWHQCDVHPTPATTTCPFGQIGADSFATAGITTRGHALFGASYCQLGNTSRLLGIGAHPEDVLYCINRMAIETRIILLTE
mmetsp:Transcript_38257/g.91972  ORF Transcript_38257/g.91972 Transcript_38257/m.91972 type:complete len:88 (+) Transcript_38257:48-311(+)